MSHNSRAIKTALNINVFWNDDFFRNLLKLTYASCKNFRIIIFDLTKFLVMSYFWTSSIWAFIFVIIIFDIPSLYIYFKFSYSSLYLYLCRRIVWCSLTFECQWFSYEKRVKLGWNFGWKKLCNFYQISPWFSSQGLFSPHLFLQFVAVTTNIM